MKYRPEIDGLRAVAVLPVILFHAGFGPFAGGFVGVDVFFVISGYLITTIILADMDRGEFSLVHFYERRARRILPALFLVMLCCLPLAWFALLPNDLKDFSESLAAVSLFSSNILFWRESDYFAGPAELKPLLHTWSLAIEEQYYVFFPLLLLFLWPKGARLVVSVLGILVVSSLALAQWGAYNKPTANFFLLPTRAWELGIGALVGIYMFRYQRSRNMPDQPSWFAEAAGIGGLALIGIAVFWFDEKTPFPSFYALVPTLGTALIILYASRASFAGRVLGAKVLVGVGLISYSAYLWHQPAFAFSRHFGLPGSTVALLGLSALSVALAWVSWRFVENPFRDRKIVSREAVFWIAAVGSAMFIGIGLAGTLSNGFIGRFDPSLHALLQIENNPRYVGRIASGLAGADFEDGGKRKVLIIGDSYAEDLVNAIYADGAGQRLDISFHRISGNCGNLYLKRDFSDLIDPRDLAACRKIGWYEDPQVTERIRLADSVWLVSSWSSWAAELASESVNNLVSEYGDKFIIFGTKHFGTIDLRELVATAEASGLDSLRNSPASERVRINELMRDSLQDHPYVDLLELLCGAELRCPVVNENGQLLSFDGGHLTPEGAKYLGVLLRRHPLVSPFLEPEE